MDAAIALPDAVLDSWQEWMVYRTRGTYPRQPSSPRRSLKGRYEQSSSKLYNVRVPDLTLTADLQGVGIRALWKSLGDFDLWPLYIIGLTAYIPPAPPTNYLSLTLRNLGFSVFESNMLAIPSQVGFLINVRHNLGAPLPKSKLTRYIYSFSSSPGYPDASGNELGSLPFPNGGCCPSLSHSSLFRNMRAHG